MDRDRTHQADTANAQWERLAPARLTPGGPGSTDVIGWLTRASLVLLTLAAAWLVFAGLRPLASPGATGDPAIRAARPVAAPTITVAERQRLLDSVMGSNWFDPDRQMWTHQDIAARTETDAPDQPLAADSPPDHSAAAPTIDTGTATGLLRTTAPDDLPDTLAKAYANLELRGIRLRGDGKLVAMISTVQSKSRPATRSFAVGDAFTDEQFAEEQWQIVLIDGTRDRVYLRRAGKTVELPLWRTQALSVADAGATGEMASPYPSREEVIEQLRAAGVSEEDIAEMLRLAESEDGAARAPEEPQLKGLDETLAELEKEAAPEEVKGVADVLKMMGNSEQRPRRSDRRSLAFPDVDTYQGVGRGHAIASIDDDSGTVILRDGSRWEVAPDAIRKIEGWGSAPSVSIYRGRGTSRAYVIVNELTKDYAEATHIVEATEAGSEE